MRTATVPDALLVSVGGGVSPKTAAAFIALSPAVKSATAAQAGRRVQESAMNPSRAATAYCAGKCTARSPSQYWPANAAHTVAAATPAVSTIAAALDVALGVIPAGGRRGLLYFSIPGSYGIRDKMTSFTESVCR